MLALIGSSPLANGLAGVLPPPVVRVPSPEGGSADARMAAMAALAKREIALAVAATGEDERSLLAAVAAKARGAQRCAAIVESRTLVSAQLPVSGVDRIIEPDAEFALAVASLVLGPVAAAVRGMGPDRVRVLELTIARDWCGAGRSLQSLGLPAGSRIAIIRRGDFAIAPSAGAVLNAGDRVLLVANKAVAADAAARLGVGDRGGPRALVIGRDGERVERVAHILNGAEITALPVKASEPAPHDAAEWAVLIDPEVSDVAAARDLAPAARIVATGPPPGRPPAGLTVITQLDAVASTIAQLSPRPPVECVGTIAPGELDVYRAEAGDAGRWLGVPLRELSALRGWTILAIRAGRGLHLPHPEDAIEGREVLILAGPPGAEEVLRRGLRGG